MLTEFFSNTKHINFLVIYLFSALNVIFHNFFLVDLEEKTHFFVILPLYLALLFIFFILIDIFCKKNKILENTRFVLLFVSIFLNLFPEIFINIRVLVTNIVGILVLYFISFPYSLHSRKSSSFNAYLLVFLSCFISNWNIVFLPFILIINIIYAPSKIKYISILFVAFLCFFILTIGFSDIFSIDLVKYLKENVDYTNKNNILDIKTYISLSFLLLISLFCRIFNSFSPVKLNINSHNILYYYSIILLPTFYLSYSTNNLIFSIYCIIFGVICSFFVGKVQNNKLKEYFIGFLSLSPIIFALFEVIYR